MYTYVDKSAVDRPGLIDYRHILYMGRLIKLLSLPGWKKKNVDSLID